MPKGPLPMDDYDGPILAGQRWRNRGVAGHGQDYLNVLRCNGKSVQVVYEGQRTGGSAHKSGGRYGIPIEAFRRNYILVTQAPGYKPEPEPEVAVTAGASETAPPRRDLPLERYFRKHRRVEQIMGVLEGTDLRFAVAEPVFAHLLPPEPLRALAAAEAAVRKLPTREEPPPVEVVEPAVDDVPIAEGAEEPTHAEAVAPTVPGYYQEGYRDGPPPAPDAPDAIPDVIPLPEADPLDAFLENGRALVRTLDAEVQTLAGEHDRLMRLVGDVEDKLREASRRRDRISAGVDAAIAAALGVPEAEPAEPAEPVRTVTAGKGGATRLMGPNGFIPRPGKRSQREWVMERLQRDGKVVIQEIVGEFAVYFEIPRDQAIKNISSLMGYQIKKPNPQWPVVVRTGQGVYVARPARGSI